MIEVPAVITLESAKDMVISILENIKMTPIADLICTNNNNNYSIIQILAESHISIHTLDNKSYIDIFSCKWFSSKKVITLLETFYNKSLYYQEIIRGKQFYNR